VYTKTIAAAALLTRKSQEVRLTISMLGFFTKKAQKLFYNLSNNTRTDGLATFTDSGNIRSTDEYMHILLFIQLAFIQPIVNTAIMPTQSVA
jgi:hypothetical protein